MASSGEPPTSRTPLLYSGPEHPQAGHWAKWGLSKPGEGLKPQPHWTQKRQWSLRFQLSTILARLGLTLDSHLGQSRSLQCSAWWQLAGRRAGRASCAVAEAFAPALCLSGQVEPGTRQPLWASVPLSLNGERNLQHIKDDKELL